MNDNFWGGDITGKTAMRRFNIPVIEKQKQQGQFLAKKGALLLESIKHTLRVIVEQCAIRRYTWYNLPAGLTSELAERILYYRYKGMFFFDSTLFEMGKQHFHFLPYTLASDQAVDGTIDFYGRYQRLRPMVFNGRTDVQADADKKNILLSNMTRTPLYTTDEFIEEAEDERDDSGKYVMDKFCAVCRDYSEQLTQEGASRSAMVEKLIDMACEQFLLSRTASFGAAAPNILGIKDESQKEAVELELQSIQEAALGGKNYIPVVGAMDLQDIKTGNTSDCFGFWANFEAIKNFILESIGITNNGVLQKGSTVLNAEKALSQLQTALIYQDGLLLRQEFANVVNQQFGLNVYCMPTESIFAEIGSNGKNVDVYQSKGGNPYSPMPEQEEVL